MILGENVDLRSGIRDLMTRNRWSKDTLAGRMDVSYVTLNGWLNGGDSAKCEVNARLLLSGGSIPVRPVERPVRTPLAESAVTAIPTGFRLVIPNTRPVVGMEVVVRKGYLSMSDEVIEKLGNAAYVAVHVNDHDRTVLLIGTDESTKGFIRRTTGGGKSNSIDVPRREISGGVAHKWMLNNGFEIGTSYIAVPMYGGVVLSPDRRS